MKTEDAEEYTQSLGQIVAGGWRQIALGKRLGVPKALGLSLEDWVQQRLGGYVRLSVSERREAHKSLSNDGESTRDIAEITGVSHMTVQRDLETVTNVPASEDQTEISKENQNPQDNVVTNVTPLNVLATLAADDEIRDIAAKAATHKKRADKEATDPPYEKNAISLVSDIAKEAKRILRPGFRLLG